MTKKIAQFFSLVPFNPALLGLTILIVAVFRSSMSGVERTAWLLAILVLDGVMPLSFYLYFIKKGYVFDDTLDNTKVLQNRVTIFLIILVTIALQFLIVVTGPKFSPIMFVFSGALIAISLTLIITYFWKISLHTGMATLFVCMIIYLFGLVKAWPVVFVLPLVFWARLVLSRHNIWQLLAGCLFALLVILIALYLNGRLFTLSIL